MFCSEGEGRCHFFPFLPICVPLPSPGAALATAGLGLVPPRRCGAAQRQCQGSAAPAPCSGCDLLCAARDPRIRPSVHVSICPSCSAAHPPSAEPRGGPDTGSAVEGTRHTPPAPVRTKEGSCSTGCSAGPHRTPGCTELGTALCVIPSPQHSPGCDPIPRATWWPHSPPLMLHYKEKNLPRTTFVTKVINIIGLAHQN